MNKKLKLYSLLSIVFLLILTGCGKDSKEKENDTPQEKNDKYQIVNNIDNITLEKGDTKYTFDNYLGKYNDKYYFSADGKIKYAYKEGNEYKIADWITLPDGLCFGYETGGCITTSVSNAVILGDKMYFDISGSSSYENELLVLDMNAKSKDDIKSILTNVKRWDIDTKTNKIYFGYLKFGADKYNIIEYDIATGNKINLINSKSFGSFNYIDGKIVYHEKNDNKIIINIYDVATKETKTIVEKPTTYELVRVVVALDNNKVYYVDGSKNVYVYDLNTGKEEIYYTSNSNIFGIESFGEETFLLSSSGSAEVISKGKKVDNARLILESNM